MSKYPKDTYTPANDVDDGPGCYDYECNVFLVVV